MQTGAVYCTSDGGRNWTNTGDFGGIPGFTGGIAGFDFSSKSNGFMIVDDVLYRTNDAGNTWDIQETGIATNWAEVDTCEGNSDSVLLLGTDGNIVRGA